MRDPAFLLDTLEYAKYGAVFWPDFGRFAPEREVWTAAGTPFRDEPEFESGQIVVNKRRCWKALNVAMHLNEYSDWWYRLIHGDKDTFHRAWRKIGQDYAMPSRGVEAMDGTMLQFDFAGERLFQHRNFAKWKLGEFESGRQEGRKIGKMSSDRQDSTKSAKSTGQFPNAHYKAARAVHRRIAGFRFAALTALQVAGIADSSA